MHNIVLVDGPHWSNLLPLTSTRPVAECRCGILTIADKWRLYLNASVSYLTEPYLSRLYPARIARENIFINSGLLPDNGVVSVIKQMPLGKILFCENKFVAARLNEDDSRQFLTDKLNASIDGANQIKGLSFLNFPEDIVTFNRNELTKDYQLLTKGRTSAKISDSNRIIGRDIFVEDGALISHSILDSSTGPIYISQNVRILEGCLIKGPLALGPGSVLKMGGKFYGSISTGPNCKLGGEVKNSVFFGNTSKSHDGYIGDSVIGEWCNFGAGSSASNMKNTYGKISLYSPANQSKRKTQLTFCGIVMGDHAKCAINTSFNTGSVIGVGANIFNYDPSGYVPPFSWGPDKRFERDKLIEVCARVMTRKNNALTNDMKEVLEYLYDNTGDRA